MQQRTNNGRNWTAKLRKHRTIEEKEHYLNMWISEADAIKQAERNERKMKRKDNLRRKEKTSQKQCLQQYFHQKNKHLPPPFVEYAEQFLKWTREVLSQIDQHIRKLMTMPKALHPVDKKRILYIYQEKKEKEDSPVCVDASIRGQH